MAEATSFFGEARKRGQRAVDVDVKGRLLKRLLDAGIGDPWDRPDFRQQRIRVFAIGHKIPAGDLQVDRRRHAKIQDLTDDIRRQEGKAGTGELLRQFPPAWS